MGVGSVVHFVYAFLTDYDGSGSLAQKAPGGTFMPGLDITIMYIFDIRAAIAIVTNFLALSGIPFFPLCDLAKKSLPNTTHW